MTRRSERRYRMAALLEEAFDSGALVFSEPLLDAIHAASPEELPGCVRSEQGVVYDIERKLGRGGMATVYLARDPKHDRPIAIKVLHAELTARLGAERFVREIRLTARLQHPHVLGLLDSGVFDRGAGALAGRPYYVMPYVEGESLRERLARDGALAVADAVRVLREVADALCYAHEKGVVHRDIKPENILLTRGHAVVADFGIAMAIAAQRADALGTPAYMAAEQATAGANVDHRADLYAWGVVAYETLTGKHPFGDRRSAADLLAAHVSERPPAISESAPAVPPALDTLVMRCLANAAADRPGSAAELLTALDAAAIAARTESSPLRTAPRRSRRRALAALGALLVVAAGIVYASMRVRAAVRRKAVVVATGNAAIDVAAVQAAVDRADTVVLDGHFSFRRPPTKLVDPRIASAKITNARAAQVRVSRAVSISGVSDARGRMATIDGGTVPLYVDAPGARVTIRGLHFVRPITTAILVRAAHGLEIAGNQIDGVEPFPRSAIGIAINTSGSIPAPGSAGSPGDVSGIVIVGQNDIDLSGDSTGANRLGVLVWSVGQSPGAEVNLDIVGNHIRNASSSAIMARRVNGHVRVLGNTVTTSSVVAPGGSEAVRLVNTGSYLMAHNTINCRWPNCVGIAVFSQFGEWPIRGAIVEDNQVNMLPPPRSVFGDSSAAIEIKGFATSNVIRYNIIRGRARTALGINMYRGGIPEDNAFIDNHVDDFHPSLASAVVGNGALRTRLVRAGTVVDRGEKTKIEP